MVALREVLIEMSATESWVLRTDIARRAILSVEGDAKRLRMAKRIEKVFGKSTDGILPEIGVPNFRLGIHAASCGK